MRVRFFFLACMYVAMSCVCMYNSNILPKHINIETTKNNFNYQIYKNKTF